MTDYFDESTFIVVENKQIIAEIINNGSEKTRLDKIKFAKEIANGRKLKIYCKCAVGDFKDILEYKISTDYRIYPAKHNNLKFHKLYCSRNYENRESVKYNKGFQEDEAGNVTTKIRKLEKRKRTDEPYNTHMYDFTRIKDGTLPISGFIKNMMLKVYEEYSKIEHEDYSLDNFLKYFYKRRNNFFIHGFKKSLNDLRFNTDGVEFIFGKVSKIEKMKNSNYKISFDICQNNKKDIFISEFDYKSMYKEFNICYYENKIIDVSLYPIMICGFKMKQKNTKYYDTNLHFLLVNKYGQLCENFDEYKIFNYITDYLVTNNLWGKASFYKPYRFGFSIYSYTYMDGEEEFVGDYLEDAIITIKNRPEVFVIDIWENSYEYRNKYNKKNFFIGRLNNYSVIHLDLTDDDFEVLNLYLDKLKRIVVNNKI